MYCTVCDRNHTLVFQLTLGTDWSVSVGSSSVCRYINVMLHHSVINEYILLMYTLLF